MQSINPNQSHNPEVKLTCESILCTKKESKENVYTRMSTQGKMKTSSVKAFFHKGAELSQYRIIKWFGLEGTLKNI